MVHIKKMHVIMFLQGESFAWPERVPFRLTHNMVAAMGPLGVEGTFRRSCEITLRVLRAQSETLMSVLRPFVYDPMVTWRSTSARPPARKECVETTNELVCIRVFTKSNQSYQLLVFLPRWAVRNRWTPW